MAPARKKRKIAMNVPSHATSNVDRQQWDDASPAEQTQDKAVQQQRRSLFVRSLPASTTTDSLTELFSSSYPIKHATAVIDQGTKQCKGYGFVTFTDAEDAQRASAEFNGYTLEGKKLRVEVAEPRHRDEAKKEGTQLRRGKEIRPKQETTPQPSRLIVRNLPWTVKTPDQLSKLFLSYGKIKHAYIPKGQHGLMAGFGFVVLRGRKNAEKALQGINGKEVDGRTLAVDWAVRKDVYEGLLSKGVEDEEHLADVQQADDEDDNGNEEDEPMWGGEDDGASEEGSEASDVEEEELLEDDVGRQAPGDKNHDHAEKKQDTSSTVFVRNLPFTCTDEDLEDHFSGFGKTRYARVVMDPGTARSKGTAFVCFYDKSEADACFRNAPRPTTQSNADVQDKTSKPTSGSILQNEASDSSGRYTMDGRVLQVSRAVDRSQADRLTQEGVAHRHKRNEDKRRLYLLSEGTISSKSKLWEKLSTSERNMRDASAKQRKSLIESNPSLHFSLTRLSVRNIPRSVTSKDLKSLAREAVVGFATDVKAGSRQKLSKEEIARAGEDGEAAEKARKTAGKGIVKQAKIVFEGAGGGKVEEASGAGSSRGYGFIEYHTHRNALMGLRWLNGHAVEYQVKDEKKGKATKEQIQDRKKRLIVEFAIENAQVVMRRKDRELKARDRSIAVQNGALSAEEPEQRTDAATRNPQALKRKRESNAKPRKFAKPTADKPEKQSKLPTDEKTANHNRIIGRKRAMRRAREGGK